MEMDEWNSYIIDVVADVIVAYVGINFKTLYAMCWRREINNNRNPV